MTRMLCSILLSIFLMTTVSSCSLFETDDDVVSADELGGEGLSSEGEFADDSLDEELGSGDEDLADSSGDLEDDFDEDFGDEEIADNDSQSVEDLDEQLVNDELDDFQAETNEIGQEAPVDEFVVDSSPIIDEPVPAQPIVDVPFQDEQGGASNNQITNLGYKSFENGGTVVIETSTPAQYQVREEPGLNQIIVEVDGVNLPDRFKRPYVTKDFKQDIATINAYQDQGSSTARFVIQLKRPISPMVQQEGSSILVMTNQPQQDFAVQDNKKFGGTLGLPDSSNSLESVEYKGELMSFEVTGTDIRDVIQQIAEQSGVNLIIDSDVKGTVNLRLRDVPWDQALMVLLKTNGLGYVKDGNVLRIAKQSTLSTEAEQISTQIENEKKARELAGGIKVKYIPVSYASVEELEKKLKDFVSEKGKVAHDTRTSSIVITDYEEYIARMTKLISALDIPPLQVEIESKLIEAREEFVREAGINWGAGGQDFSAGGKTGNLSFNSGPFETSAATRGLSLDLSYGTFDIFGDLTAALGLFERQNKIKVLSQPKVQVLNKEKAAISSITQIPIKQITNTQGTVTESITFQDLVLSLDVTPQITFRGDVIMEVELRREFAGTSVEDGQRELNKRKAKTTVMVKNGKTAVIGGIYQLDDTDGDRGVPWLKDLPIIGYLFKQISQEKRKSELLLFLKPKILKDESSSLISKAEEGPAFGSTDDFEEMSVDEGSFDDSSFEDGEEL